MPVTQVILRGVFKRVHNMLFINGNYRLCALDVPIDLSHPQAPAGNTQTEATTGNHLCVNRFAPPAPSALLKSPGLPVGGRFHHSPVES